MSAGPVNQALLQAHFQQPGQVYSDSETEACLQVLATQIDDNWTNQAALNDAVNGLVVGTQVIDQKMNLYRQALINGNLDVWQRGANFVLGAEELYTADRWLTYRTGLVTGAETFQRSESPASGSRYSAEVSRTGALTNKVNFAQALPSDDSIKLRGQQLTLSFSARKLTDFSSAGSVLTAQVSYGTGTDQNASEPITGQVIIGTAGFTLTSSFQKFKLTTTAVPTGATQLFVHFSFTPVGAAGADDGFRIGAIQLCAGTVDLPMQPRSYHDELEECQRYFIGTFGDNHGLGTGIALSTTDARIQINIPKTMRVAPSFAIPFPSGTDLQVTDGVSTFDITTYTQITAETSPNLVTLQVVTAGLTQFRPYQLKGDGGASRRYFYNAEF